MTGNGCHLRSNRESGDGYPDITLTGSYTAAVMELKRTKAGTAPAGRMALMQAAVNQIQNLKYAQELSSQGYSEVYCYALVFCGKRCEIKALAAAQSGHATS